MLSKINKRAADSLADPTEYENLFPGLRDTFKTEQFLKPQYTKSLPASNYAKIPVSTLHTFTSNYFTYVSMCVYIYIYIYLLIYYLPAFTVTRKKEKKPRQEQEIKISWITARGKKEKIS